MVPRATGICPEHALLAFGQIWAKSCPSTGFPGEGSGPARPAAAAQAHRGSQEGWARVGRAFKAAAASWERQPLCGQAWGWEMVGRKALGLKGSLEGAHE